MIEFYFAKIESYLRRKNENALKVLEVDKTSPTKSETEEQNNLSQASLIKSEYTNETCLKESNRSNCSSVEEFFVKKSQSDLENHGTEIDSDID